MRLKTENILVIGDARRQMASALAQAMPAARLTSVPTYFDAIAELCAGQYSAVLGAVEPIERRPEAAVRMIRDLAGDARVLLFGHPTLEPLARKMLDLGCDDYLVTPVNAAELQQMFGVPLLRLAAPPSDANAAPEPPPLPLLAGMPLAEVMLDAQVQHPHDAVAAALRSINAAIAPAAQLHYQSLGKDAPPAVEGSTRLSHPVRADNKEVGHLHLSAAGMDEQSARHFLAQLAHLIGKLAFLEDRHVRTVHAAITDQLTGVYNRRYFEHFLARIIDKARIMRFAVTLLAFDIDNFKKYNDEFGHGQGDEILRETANLMKRCCREHDLVARIGGDEFVVVFWEKEGPRQPKSPGLQPASRSQQTPRQIFDRFRRILATRELPALGSGGRGLLSISGGFASYPWDGRDGPELVAAADRDLMFNAKREKKNTIFLVGDHPSPPDPRD